jgi:hypothetical protein
VTLLAGAMNTVYMDQSDESSGSRSCTGTKRPSGGVHSLGDFAYVRGGKISSKVVFLMRRLIISYFLNIYRNLRTQQMSVLVLLCTSYTTCFDPYRWPSSGGFVTQIFECSYCMSTDPLLQYVNM